MSCHIDLLTLPGCMATSIVASAEMLMTANRIAQNIGGEDKQPFNCRTVSISGNSVQCSSGHSLSVDTQAGAAPVTAGNRVLLVPAFNIGSPEELNSHLNQWQEAIDWLKLHHEDYQLIASSCSGNLLLAESGLLNGHSATCSWWLAQQFEQRYPNVLLQADAVLVQSRPFLSGGSSSAWQDVCLHIIEQYAGKHIARLTSKYMMVDNQRRSQSPYTILSLFGHDDPLVTDAESWIRKRLSEDFRIEEVAEHVGVTARTLIRRFQKALSESPQAYIQRLRIEKSKVLLETTNLPLTTIVQRCGYTDESAFRRLFKKYCTLSPREYRRRFRTENSAASTGST